jgi:serine/threonine protein kinase
MPDPMTSDRHCPRCNAALPPDAPEGLCPACLAKAAIDTEAGAQAPPAGGARSTPPTIEEIGRHFPQLEILQVLGQGGMGVVYKARQTKLDRFVALKILPREAGKDPAFAERFAREARTLARLNHPNIVAIYDFGETGGLFYFLMEYVDGLNLRELEQSRQLTPEQALAIVPRICDALQFAHEEGIVHRDIKPGNILIDRKGRVKIADFGLAKLLGKPAASLSLTASGHLMGTPHYMAPEQIDRPQLVDHRADIYSLGVVFYEMLTGELPMGRFAAPSQKVHVDVRLDDVVLRALENNPERRYQQASDVRTDVESITGSPPPRIPGAPILSAAPPPAPGDRMRAQERVKIPGFALMTYSIVNMTSLAIPLSLGSSKVAILFGHSPMGGIPIHLWPLAILPLPLLFLASQVCLLVGATKLRNLSSYGWALAAAVIACLPAGPLWLIGLGLGIWTLFVIHQPEVRAAFGEPSATTSSAAAPLSDIRNASNIPRFSAKAILGACLIAVGMVLLVSWSPPMTGLRSQLLMELPASSYQTVRFAPALFTLTPFVLGLAIVGTMLGISAIKDIRYSNGRIVGLPLAVADALFFPLLLLDALVLFGLQIAMRGTVGYLIPHHAPGIGDPSIAATFLLGLLLCAALDYVIVSACWRAARRPAIS